MLRREGMKRYLDPRRSFGHVKENYKKPSTTLPISVALGDWTYDQARRGFLERQILQDNRAVEELASVCMRNHSYMMLSNLNLSSDYPTPVFARLLPGSSRKWNSESPGSRTNDPHFKPFRSCP
jgi:hypothetical protein